MKSITFEGKKINFDFTLGFIHDVYTKEFGGKLDDLINLESLQHESPTRVSEVIRDSILSAHIYWLYCNGEDEVADSMLSRLRGSRMIATKWLLQIKLENAIAWIAEGLTPSDLDSPKSIPSKKK